MNKVLLIYTGGTIGMGQNPLTGALEPLDFNHLVESMPEFQLIKTDIDVYQFTPPIDSSEMSPNKWAQLVRIINRNYDDYDGFVVLHGTDTMAYTASALSFMLEGLTKPVILTGSQLPIGQLRTDGKENLVTSIELAALKDEQGHARVPEVCIYFSGVLLRGNRSTKINADGFNAFLAHQLCGFHLANVRGVLGNGRAGGNRGFRNQKESKVCAVAEGQRNAACFLDSTNKAESLVAHGANRRTEDFGNLSRIRMYGNDERGEKHGKNQ